jgi:hypothetical protein
MIASPTLSISPEKISSVIERAHRRDTAQMAPDDDPLPFHADAPALQELAKIIDELSDDEQADIIALMWLGRGDGEVREWHELREEAALLHNKHGTAYLLAKPLLADYLTEGLATLGYRTRAN